MKISASSPDEYINKLPDDRKQVVGKLRQVILENLPDGFVETISYGMIGYVVPKSIYPEGYHANHDLPLPFINLASQKNHIALYHSGIYADENLQKWFVEEYKKYSSLKLDMGKSCIRFKNMEKIPFDLIAELVEKMSVNEWINLYEKMTKR